MFFHISYQAERMTNIAIFASGNGSNAQRMIDFFARHPHIRIALVVSNNKNAFVLTRAENSGIPGFFLSAQGLRSVAPLLALLQQFNTGFIVLAGFLLKIPAEVVKAYPRQIVNIHPALLPEYGGKGMYGAHVHNAVIQNREEYSGITIHFVNEEYDEGHIIFQKKCRVDPDDTPETLARKVQQLEHLHYPIIVEQLISST
jgi:phosphoribosylglycinamide formyltransferase 1